MTISCSATSSSLFREEEAQRKKKNLVAFAIAKYMICNWTGEQLATHISASSEPLRKIVAVVALFYLQREGEGRGKREEEGRGGKWTTLPHDITIPRRVPEIEFCHRSIVTRARQRSPRLYRRDSATHFSPWINYITARRPAVDGVDRWYAFNFF